MYREMQFEKQLMPKNDKSYEELDCERTSKCIQMSH